MPYRLFREWQLFWEREPWGGTHEDMRFGILASLLDVANRGAEARGPGEFFPSLRRIVDAEQADLGAQLEAAKRHLSK